MADLSSAERGLLSYLQAAAEVYTRGGLVEQAGRGGWRHPTLYHLLLAEGRFFTPRQLPGEVRPMPLSECYRNAALTALRSKGALLYAEGFAVVVGHPLEHAWCVDAATGDVVDPTWHGATRMTACLGLTVADPALWPHDGTSILADDRRLVPLLRNGATGLQHPLIGRRTAGLLPQHPFATASALSPDGERANSGPWPP